MRKQNDGFSLVELIVSMAILMIAAAALLGLFSYCIRQYQKTNADVDLQYESQLFSNRMENQLMQTSGKVYVEGQKQILYLQSDDVLEKFYVDQTDKRLMYQQYIWKDGGWQPDGDAECFASYMSRWQLVCYDKNGQAIVATDDSEASKIEISYQMQALDETFQATETVAFRGRLKHARPDGV